MKQSLLIVAVMAASSMGWAANTRPGIVLRMTGKALVPHSTGKIPEFRLMSDGRELLGSCGGSPVTCDTKQIRRLSQGEMTGILSFVKEARRGTIGRWISNAKCFRAPSYKTEYSADNGSVFLKSGHLCLGGGKINQSKAALELLKFISDEIGSNN